MRLAWRVLKSHYGSAVCTAVMIVLELIRHFHLPRIVKVVDLVDDHINPHYLGMLGWAKGPVLPHDHGASDVDPLVLVLLEDGHKDGFWREELAGPNDQVQIPQEELQELLREYDER